MSDAEERLALIKQNYDSAADNEPNDLVNAKDVASVTAIQANLAKAKSVYYSAITSELTNTAPTVDKAFKLAKDALKAIEDARNAAAELPDIINKLAYGTDKANTLLNKAKKI